MRSPAARRLRRTAIGMGCASLLLPGAASASLPAGCTATADSSTVACTWTSGTAQFQVPDGLTHVHPVLVGGSGGAAYNPDGTLSARGGEGAVLANGDLTVAPGETLGVAVGGNGGSRVGYHVGQFFFPPQSIAGANGGGTGSTSCPQGRPAGGGGGRSEIDYAASPIAIAGGGGGAGCKGALPAGGQGDLGAAGLGGDAGLANATSPSSDAVDGEGSQSCPTQGGGAKYDTVTNVGSPGAAGKAQPTASQPCFTGYTYGTDGTAGSGGWNYTGGNGGNGVTVYGTTSGGGGGGGGGWYSGGGGAGGPVENPAPGSATASDSGFGGGGGGGGSSYASPGDATGLHKAVFSQDSTDPTASPYVEIDYFTLAFNATLPDAAACGKPYYYNYAVVDASNTQPTLSESGALPPGLVFDPGQQTITGTPTATGTWTFTVSADAAGAAVPVSRTDTITTTDPSAVCTPQQPQQQPQPQPQPQPAPEPSPEPAPAGSVPGSYGTGPTASYFFPSSAGGLGTDFGTVGAASGGSTGATPAAVPTRTGRGGAIVITLPFACKGPASCSATITARATVASRTVTVGKVRFTIPGGTKQDVALALNRRGRALLKTHASLPVRLTISRGTTTIGTTQVRVRAPKRG